MLGNSWWSMNWFKLWCFLSVAWHEIVTVKVQTMMILLESEVLLGEIGKCNNIIHRFFFLLLYKIRKKKAENFMTSTNGLNLSREKPSNHISYSCIFPWKEKWSDLVRQEVFGGREGSWSNQYVTRHDITSSLSRVSFYIFGLLAAKRCHCEMFSSGELFPLHKDLFVTLTHLHKSVKRTMKPGFKQSRVQRTLYAVALDRQ